MSISLQRLQVIGAEPISLAEAKLHLRVDFADDDTLIESLITAARQYAEQVTGRSLVKSQWLYSLDCFPWNYPVNGNVFPPARTTISTFVDGWVDAQSIYLPRSPLISVDSIKYCPSVPASYVTLDPSQYVVDTGSEPSRVSPGLNCYWPMTQILPNSVQITFTAGYDVVPAPIIAAMKLMIGNWYDNRSDSKDVPVAANYILSSYRLSAAGLI